MLESVGGMSLEELISKTTLRQRNAYLDWLDEQKNQPTTDQHYLMQIAREVYCAQLRPEDQEQVELEQFKLTWSKVTEEPQYETEEQAQQRAQVLKGNVLSMMGGMAKKVVNKVLGK